MAQPAPKPTFGTFVVVTVVVIGGFAGVLFVIASTNPGPATLTLPLGGPLEIGPPYNPGGPVLSLSLQNKGIIPIDYVTAQIQIQPSRGYGPDWVSMYLQSPLDITPASPLLPGQTVLFVVALIGPWYVPCGASYPVSIAGTYSGGLAFGEVASEPLLCN